MKLAFSTICINPTKPTRQEGFLYQTKPIYNFHDDLYARIIAFENEEEVVYLISTDTIGCPISMQDSLEHILQQKTDKKVKVTLCATHTHFGGETKDHRYQGELIEKVVYAIEYLNYQEYDNLEISYQCVPFEKVGKSRISNHKANVLLQLFTIYNNKQPLVQMIVHNCHPTIHQGETPYFTGEYPGYVLQQLKYKYPNTYFTFLQGAAGDVSTRFTRDSQDYSSVITLGNHLVEEVERLMNEEKEYVPFDKFVYDATIVPMEHEFNPIDLSNIPANLSERELFTINEGVIMREALSKRLYTLDKDVKVSKLDLGKYTLVFMPNEAFSSYIDCMDTKRSALVAYSNGASPYITGIDDNFITYEKFTDTVTVNVKKELIKVLENYGK